MIKMSFRVKTTHHLLQNNPPPKPQEKNAISFFEVPDEKDVYVPSSFLPSEKKTQQDNRPKCSSAKGVAIRTVTSAQADHM
jgi:hypothetical protein